MKKFTTLEDLPKLKKLVITKSWWETVDTLVKVFTDLYLRYPTEMTQLMLTWSKDSNLWVKRIALEFQLLLKKQTDTKLLAKIIINNFGSDEFLSIKRSVGPCVTIPRQILSGWLNSLQHTVTICLLSVFVREVNILCKIKLNFFEKN